MTLAESMLWILAAATCVLGLSLLFWHQARLPRCAACGVFLVPATGTVINPSPPVMETLYRCPRCGRTLEERVVGAWD